MKPKKRQKLCQNCEGEIDVDVIVCPFCAADLREERPEQKVSPISVRNLSDNETMKSLYPPPYKMAEEVVSPVDAPAATAHSEERKEKIFSRRLSSLPSAFSSASWGCSCSFSPIKGW